MTNTMKRLETLKNFAEATQLLVTAAQQTKITSDDIAHLRALEPEFNGAVETLLQLFGAVTPATTTPTTTEPVANTLSEEEPTELTPTDTLEVTAPDPATTNTEVVETWKACPILNDVRISTLGNVQVLSPKGEWIAAKVSRYDGYMKFYDPSSRKYYSLAKMVLTTFSGRRNNTYAPIYLDADRSNCTLENLRWGVRDSSLSVLQVERACELIKKNPTLGENEMINMLTEANTIKSVTAYRSILAGNWKSVSDRYFLVRQGRIIPVGDTASETTTAPVDEVDDSGNLKGILSLTKDPEFVKKLYKERLDAHKASSDDLVALILSYMMMGLDDVATIQKAIRKDFGRKLMVSNAQLKSIIG